MSFLTFFSYFIASKLIYEATIVLLYFIRYKIIENKTKKDLKSGKIKMVTMDELLEEMQANPDKKMWN